MENHINISGVCIPCKYDKLDIYKLEFFEENPRIGSIIEKHKDRVDQSFIDSKLWERNETHVLKRRIEEDGGLIHPILIHGNKVIEGNTRLCAYRHLYEETKSDKWKTIECQILLTDIDKKQVYRLLCNEHIVGKIEWDTYEKGNMLTRMLEEENMDYEEIKNISKLSVPKIRENIAAYKLMVKENDSNPRRFSHYVQLVINQEVKKISKNKDSQIYKKVVDAIKNDQFPDAKHIRHIHEVYNDKTSRKRFFEEGEEFPQVYYDLKATKITLSSTFLKTVEDLTERMGKLTREEREEIKDSNEGKIKVEKLFKNLVNFCSELNIEIHIPNKFMKHKKGK